ncbi:MAG TPA: hypothetical protein VMM36_02375 [Opitutaceae bacterium]|nr:hypothetical protein [Opitutaceae bacterium]
MTLKRRTILLFLAAVALMAVAGCTKRQDENAIPWSRPADWEGRIPGMGG